jgi:DNA polymerase-3 subunit epsilon
MSDRKFVDVQNIFHQMEQRTLRAAYKFYCDKDIKNAHSAEADITATYHVLLAQLERYHDSDFEDKQGNISKPVQNDVHALHQFTNMNKPVDFAGRMVYNENDEETFNFGKHKGKTVEQVFDVEPSYYAWMKQGDFPLYTKKKLDEIWARWNKKKDQARAAKQMQQPRPQQAAPQSAAPQQPAPQQPAPQQASSQAAAPKPAPVPAAPKPEAHPRPQFKSQPEKPKEKPAVDVTTDMLEQLKMKFGK